MKTIKHILPVLTLVCSCSFLEENPETMLSEASVYRTEESLESSIRGIMETFYASSMYTHDMQEFMQTASCLIFFPMSSPGTYNTNERYYSSYHYSQSPTTQLNNEIYSGHYKGIARCNKLIEGLKDSPVNEKYKTEIEAEAKFLRAVLYFGLVRFYGNVPLVTHMPKTSDDADKPREPYWNIYRQILEDLEFAENNMREADRAESVNPGDSRPNRWAATAFKAAVYMQIGSYLSYPEDHAFGTVRTQKMEVDFTACGIKTAAQAWEEALYTAEKVIDHGPYSLVSDWSELFRWTEYPHDWMLPERIFVLPMTSEAGAGQLSRRSLPPYPEGTMHTGESNSNYGRFRPTRFVFQKWCETYGGEKGVGENNADIYVSCPDPRFDATFIHTKTTNMKSGKAYEIYPADKYIRTDSRQYFSPYFRKYLDPTFNGHNVGQADFYFMRFAEMHLIAAEAAAELCTTPDDTYGQKAFSHIEELHKRARGELSEKAVKSLQPKWKSGRFKDKKELVSAIFWERIFEMYGEGHEWFDTHRKGVNWFLDNVITPTNAFLERDEQEEMRSWYGETFLFPAKPDEVRKGLFNAFPENELTYNSVLNLQDQNLYIWN